MKVTEPEESRQYSLLYDATIKQAVGGAPALMTRLVAHVRADLRERAQAVADRRERDALTDARRRLNQLEATLGARFTEELTTAFSRKASMERPMPAAPRAPHFDELAQMDDEQLRQSVAAARERQQLQLASDTALEELTRLLCVTLGLPPVQLERNPLRAPAYLEALTAAVTHLPVPSSMRQGWISMMTAALGRELEAHFQHLCQGLRERAGGAAASPAGLDEGGNSAARAQDGEVHHPLAGHAQASLTLEKLRRLLAQRPQATDADLAQRYDSQFAERQNDSQFENSRSVPTGFRATVPAAFDAMQELRQVDQVVQRLKAGAGAVPPADPVEQLREDLRRSAHGVEQALGQEVVALMVDSISHDRRLLGPVQSLVAGLEPALLQLALVDPRFFSHRDHPARRLLHEITHRSIAFESVDSRGFSGFMEPLREAVAPLSAGAIDTAEPFDKALGRLVELWDETALRDKRQLSRAVRALQQAEQRNALAATIVEALRARADLALLPSEVIDFLAGPWAQVIAHARMIDTSGAMDPGGYAAAIDELIWSAQPQLTRGSVPRLTRLASGLPAVLRAGLATIDFAPQKTSTFFETLTALHQEGFKPQGESGPAATAPPRKAGAVPTGAAWLGGEDALWVAPQEARASGFIDLSTEAPSLPVATRLDELVVGVWVALKADGSWSRTRLSWASANGTLLLFTDALGYMQSLTRNACEQLFAAGDLRIISADPVEDALDAVAQAAMLNSVDIRF